MKKRIRLLALCGAAILAGIQFIRPARNQGLAAGPDEISARWAMPEDVHRTMMAACYDCHSNHTDYPWYAGVQPVGWWLARHVNEGRRELNFSEFGRYPQRRILRKLDAIAEEVGEGGMPLSSYAWMHPTARLNPGQRKMIVQWAQALHDQFQPEPPHAPPP
jgi:hypothetical protein